MGVGNHLRPAGALQQLQQLVQHNLADTELKGLGSSGRGEVRAASHVHGGRVFLAFDSDLPWSGRLHCLEADNVATDTVKWFNATKGFGFIQPATVYWSRGVGDPGAGAGSGSGVIATGGGGARWGAFAVLSPTVPFAAGAGGRSSASTLALSAARL